MAGKPMFQFATNSTDGMLDCPLNYTGPWSGQGTTSYVVSFYSNLHLF